MRVWAVVVVAVASIGCGSPSETLQPLSTDSTNPPQPSEVTFSNLSEAVVFNPSSLCVTPGTIASVEVSAVGGDIEIPRWVVLEAENGDSYQLSLEQGRLVVVDPSNPTTTVPAIAPFSVVAGTSISVLIGTPTQPGDYSVLWKSDLPAYLVSVDDNCSGTLPSTG